MLLFITKIYHWTQQSHRKWKLWKRKTKILAAYCKPFPAVCKWDYYNYQIDCDTAKRKRTASSKLREMLDESYSRISKTRKIIVSLPDLTEHRGHDIGKVN